MNWWLDEECYPGPHEQPSGTFVDGKQITFGIPYSPPGPIVPGSMAYINGKPIGIVSSVDLNVSSPTVNIQIAGAVKAHTERRWMTS